MPGELIVAVMTQTLRVDACIGYLTSLLDSTPSHGIVVFTADPGALEPIAGVTIRSTQTPLSVLTDSSARRQVFRRRLLGWTRSGSSMGRSFEKAVRRFVAATRRSGDVSRTGEPTGSIDHPINQHLVNEIAALHAGLPLQQIVVFDLFDLPTVLPFAREAGIPVVVR